MSIPFTLPPLTLPADVISKQLGIKLPAGIDAGFYNSVLAISNGSGLFNNPFDSAISGLKTLTSQFQSLTSAAASVGGSVPLTGMITHMTDMVSVFTNIGTNIVPTQLPMSSVLASAVTSAASSLPGISAGDAPCVGPFITSLGVPSLGTVMNLSLSQYKLKEICGIVDPTNPVPLLNQFSGMLTNMTSGATSFINSSTSVVNNLLSTATSGLSSALTSGLSSVESSLGSSFGSPIASFGGSMFSTIKDQMATGLASSLRHMIETNYAMKFMTTGLDSTGGGGFSGILGTGLTSTIQNFPSNINVGRIIP